MDLFGIHLLAFYLQTLPLRHHTASSETGYAVTIQKLMTQCFEENSPSVVLDDGKEIIFPRVSSDLTLL